MGSSHTLDRLDTCFDDTHAVANAGCCWRPPLAERLGIEQTADALIDLGERPGAHRPGRKLLTLVHSMLAGGGCIDDADLLRCGQTASVLGHRVMAPSTLGTFLRSFTFGHVRQLDRLTEQQQQHEPSRRRGTGQPGDDRVRELEHALELERTRRRAAEDLAAERAHTIRTLESALRALQAHHPAPAPNPDRAAPPPAPPSDATDTAGPAPQPGMLPTVPRRRPAKRDLSQEEKAAIIGRALTRQRPPKRRWP